MKGLDAAKSVLNRLRIQRDDILKTKEPDAYSLLMRGSTRWGVSPIIPKSKKYYYYLVDPGIQNAVNTFRDQVVGIGYYLTGKNEATVKRVEAWFKTIKFRRKLKTGFGDALISGDLMFEKLFAESDRGMKKILDLDLIDQRIVVGILPDTTDANKPGKVVQKIPNDPEPNYIDYDRVVHYKLFELSRGFTGVGLFDSLAVPQYEQDGELHSILDDLQHMREAFPRIIRRFASPKEVVLFENENEAYIKEKGAEWKNMKEGETLFVNRKFEHSELTIDPRSRFDKYIDVIQLWYEIGTQTPAAKLQTTPGFTEASANAALELVERRIRGIQEDLKGIIEEEIIIPYLKGQGIDPTDDNYVEFHFGQPDVPDFDMNQVLGAALQKTPDGKPLITWKEFRKIAQMSGWPLASDEEALKEIDESQPEHEEEEEEEQPPAEDKSYVIKYQGEEFHVEEKKNAR